MVDSLMAGWWIAILGARTLIGRSFATVTRSDTMRPTMLGPVYDLQSGVQMIKQPNGSVGIARPCVAMPLLGLLSIESVEIPESAIVLACSQRSLEDRKMLSGAITIAEEICTSLRAESSGIVIAPPGMRMPKVSQ